MDISNKKKSFYLFLIINALCWSCLCLVRNIMGNDALEAISWGELIDFGTNKHPPLSGWVMGGLYNLFGQHDFVAYFLGQACILIGYIFIYKLAKFFIDEEKALSASLIMSSCYYYTYVAFYENFNCNFLSMALWPVIAYYFYKSVKGDKLTDWLIFGIISALGLLCKYQVIFLFLALFLYLIFCDRKQFKQKGMYISILTGFLIILPHIMWLLKTDFFSFIYMAERTDIGSHNTPAFLLPFGRIVFPLKFLFDQVGSVVTCIIVYLFLGLQTKKIGMNKNLKTPESIFILLITFAPILLQGCMAAIENNRILGMWGSIMVSWTGLLLFYFFPVSFNKNTFSYFKKWVYSLMILWLVVMFIFSQLQTKLHISFPYQQIIPDINKQWDITTNNSELKYIGGNIDYVYKMKEYNPRHPKVILETFGHKNPWVNHKDIIKSGVIIVGKSEKNVIRYVKEMVILLPEDNEIKPIRYDFEIKNKLGTSQKYKFYYAIIPPRTSE